MRAGFQQTEGQGTKTGANLDDHLSRKHSGNLHDAANGIRINDEVLTELLRRLNAQRLRESPDLGRPQQGGAAGWFCFRQLVRRHRINRHSHSPTWSYADGGSVTGSASHSP